MRTSIEIGSYNSRRYSRPWIGRITAWPVGARPELAWGGYAGDDNGGELEIEAQAGDIIRWGQRDGRGNGGSNEWGIAQADGTVEACDQPQARAHWAKAQAPVAVPEQTPVDPIRLISDDELIQEMRRRGLTITQEVIA